MMDHLKSYTSLFFSLALSGLVVSFTQAQVTTAITSDGTLGTTVTKNGNINDITGGTRPGGGLNLFHSFGQFSVGAGDIANFQNDSGLSTANILSRVTGGDPSQIFGTIQTIGFPEADLFLLNPAGILFGPNATLNVNGSFHISTADSIQLGQDGTFYATFTEESVLTMGSPESFGFLEGNPEGIVIDHSDLEVSARNTLSLVGGNIELIGGNLTATDGQINLVSITSPGTMSLNEGTEIQVNAGTLGEIGLSGKGLIKVDGDDGGTVVIRSGQLTMDNARISSNSSGQVETSVPENPGIDIQVTGDISLANLSLIQANVLDGSTQGRDILIKAGGNLQMRGGQTPDMTMGLLGFVDGFTGIQTVALNGSGNAGNIDVQADNTQITGESIGLLSWSFPFSSGSTGNILVTSNSLTLSGEGLTGGFIAANSFGEGQGRNIEVNVQVGNVALNNGQIAAVTFGNGDAGNLTLQAHNLLLTNQSTVQSGTGGSGNAGSGNIQLSGDLEIRDGSFIGTLVGTECEVSCGAAGDLTIEAKDIEITGVDEPSDPLNAPEFTGIRTRSVAQPGGNLIITAENLQLTNNGVIRSASLETEKAGDISVTLTENLDVASGGQFLADTSGSGNAGSITVAAENITLQGENSSIRAESTSTGNAGNISLTGDQLTVTSGGRIEASTSGQGAGGTINIMTTDDTTVSGVSSDGQTRSGIFAKTQSSGGGTGGGGGGGSGGGGSSGGGGATVQTGDAGDIIITAKNLLLNGGAQIDSSTTSSGAGGSVAISATEAITVEGASSRVTSDASRGNGRGGSIRLEAGEVIVGDGGSVTAKTGGTGDAGAIDLDVRGALSLLTGGTISTSTSGAGKGGTITAQADSILLDGTGSSITADTLPPFADLTILLSLLHEPDSDLTVQLDSPSGTRLSLFSQVGGNGQNFTDTLLSDAAGQSITTGSAPFTGTFRPREPLAQLVGEPLNGTWTLNVQDRAANNGTAGSLQSWALQTQANSLTFSPTDLPKNVVDNGAIQSGVLVNGGPDAVVQGTGEASGQGGDIVLNARSVAIQNGATLSVNNTGSGQGGSIEVQAGNIDLNNGATVSAASSGAGDAGSINLRANDTILVDNSTVTTEATEASGGNIKLQAEELIRLNDSTISSSVQGNATTVGGNISLDPEFIILQNSQILAKAIEGQGGNISLIADNAVLVDPFSVLDASSALGVSGSVDIQAPIQNLSGTIAPLPEETVPVTALYGARCAAGQGGHFSTFVDSKADSLSPTPGTFLASPLLSPSAQAVSNTSAGPNSPVVLTASISPLVLGNAGEPMTACP